MYVRKDAVYSHSGILLNFIFNLEILTPTQHVKIKRKWTSTVDCNVVFKFQCEIRLLRRVVTNY